MNTLIYTVLKKKQRLCLLYSFFVRRLNLPGLRVLSEKQLKHKNNPSNMFGSCPFADKRSGYNKGLQFFEAAMEKLGGKI